MGREGVKKMKIIVRFSGFWVGLFLIGVANGVCLAAEEQTAVLPQVSGEVVSVDGVNGLLTVKTQTGPAAATPAQFLAFVLEAKTAISKGEQLLKVADLKTGDPVTVIYATTNGQNIANSVAVAVPKKADSTTTAVAPAAKSPTTSSVK